MSETDNQGDDSPPDMSAADSINAVIDAFVVALKSADTEVDQENIDALEQQGRRLGDAFEKEIQQRQEKINRLQNELAKCRESLTANDQELSEK
jgi:hypothetical protein